MHSDKHCAPVRVRIKNNIQLQSALRGNESYLLFFA